MSVDEPSLETTDVVDDAWHGEPHKPGPRLGRYELRDLVGTGGMGAVFEARDPELDRAVAVKILRSRSDALDSVAAERLRREGVAMARLTHPNVIRVYDVGIDQGRVFIAMELVRGCTLADWLARAPRSDAAVIDTFVQAGRGLAAAHDAGLIHRDFKPQNVLVGDDGRVLVTDFGLASEVDAPTAATPEIVGTPAYMAPEQRAGGAVDQRADQFSFCVALSRALTGSDRRIQAALRRGLEIDPARRFRSMHGLLARLAPPPRRSRRWWLVAELVAVGAAVAAWVIPDDAAPDPCPAPDAQIAAVWSESRARALRDRLAAIDPAQGASRVIAAQRSIDPFVREWRDLHIATCKDTRVRGTQSDTLLDQRMRCLDHRMSELAHGLALMTSAADAVALEAAVAGLFQVTPVARCTDDGALQRLAALPLDPAQRRAVEDVVAQLEELGAALRADQLVGLPARAEAVVAAARQLQHPPTLSQAVLIAAQIQLAIGASELAATLLREVTQIAATAQDSVNEAHAWIALISTVGVHQRQPDQGPILAQAASAAIHRAGDPLELRVDLLLAQAKVLDEGLRLPEGLAMLAEARRLIEEVGASRTPALSLQLAEVLLETGSARLRSAAFGFAIESYGQAILVYRNLYGPDSVGEAKARHNMGEAHRRLGQVDDALVAYREAARINASRMGDSPRLASNLIGIASALGRQHDWAEALATYQRAYAMYRQQVEADDVSLVPVLVGLAWAFEHLDRFDDAHRTYGEITTLIETSGATTINLPIALYNRGELNRRRDRCDAALADFRRSAALFAKLRPPTSTTILFTLVGEGACLVAQRRYRDAIATLERATRWTGDKDDVQSAKARAWLGRALVESRRDRARGLAMVRAARADVAAAAGRDPEGVRDLPELDRWLSTR